LAYCLSIAYNVKACGDVAVIINKKFQNIIQMNNKIKDELTPSSGNTANAMLPEVLRLSLKKKWFEMTKAGIKTEDYREVNHYWIKRLMTKKYNTLYPIEKEAIDGILKHIDPNYLVKNHSKKFDFNVMTLGYPSNDDIERILKIEHNGVEIRIGNPEWGAEANKLYFVILHGAVIV